MRDQNKEDADILSRTVKILREASDRYERFSQENLFVSSAILPSILTVLGLICLSLKGKDELLLFLFIILYALCLILKVAVDYANGIASSKKAIRAASLDAQIQYLDECVKTKINRMNTCIKSGNTPEGILRRARGKIKLEVSATTLNKELSNAIIDYL